MKYFVTYMPYSDAINGVYVQVGETIDFISTPVTISAGYTRNKILKAVQGEK